jgi:phosphohistidine phosphatase SixA
MRSGTRCNEHTGAIRARVTISSFAVALLACVASVATAAPEPAKSATSSSVAQEQPLLGLDAALDELRKGGLVIYFRHAATEQTGEGDEAADLKNCDTQRNLSAEGRAQASQIGQAFRTLGINVSTVMTSPFCRCKDTGKLAFGRFIVNNDLYFAINTDAEKTNELAESLRKTLATSPPPGTNAVIVSHTANLREAAGIWPKPEGVAYIFRPLSGGRFEVLAKVLPDDWINAAKRK